MKLSDAIEYQETGICPLDIKKVIKCWGLSYISEYDGKFRLVNRWARVKVTISEPDARTLINKLGLVQSKSGLFALASTWHKPEQIKF
jgi:hypothetical protein